MIYVVSKGTRSATAKALARGRRMEAEAEAAAAKEISNGELCYVCVLFVTSYNTCYLFKAKSHRISIIGSATRKTNLKKL